MHSFAMQCEAEERYEEDEEWDFSKDPFMAAGLDDSDSESDEDSNVFVPRRGERVSQARLRAGRLKRDHLKEQWLSYREHRHQ